MDGENFMENAIKMGWFGGFPPIFGNTHILLIVFKTYISPPKKNQRLLTLKNNSGSVARFLEGFPPGEGEYHKSSSPVPEG